MSTLPAWLHDVKRTLPLWLAQVKHPSGPGRYRYALDAYEPYDLDSSCMLENALLVTQGMPPAEERKGWVDYLGSLQDPAEGWMIDKGMDKHIISEQTPPTENEIFMVRKWTTRNGLTTMVELGGRPKYRVAHKECCRTPAEMERLLAGFNWKSPWSAGSQAGSAVWFHEINRLAGDPEAGPVVKAAVDWLARRQDPATGFWSDDSAGIPLHNLVNGIFKIWITTIPAAGLPVQYPEKVIDLCIRAIREDRFVCASTDACNIFDVALVLDTALRFCDHRRDEVAELAFAALPAFERTLREDGAFSMGGEGEVCLQNHGGLRLAPAKRQSDAPGTGILVNALALVCNLCGLRKELGWTPTTECRMGLK